MGIEVPKYEDGKLATSSMILAAKLEKMDDREARGQFVIGQTKVIPNLTGLYHRGQPVGVYLQIYNAGIDQTTLAPLGRRRIRALKSRERGSEATGRLARNQ